MMRHSLFFTKPYQVEIRETEMQSPGTGELLVKTLFSAISPGTEMLIYRGEAPDALVADEGIDALDGLLAFPLQYGYAVVGEVIEIGAGIGCNWLGKHVFSFQPHQTHFTATPAQVILLPEGISPEMGVFLPNLETAINFAMDGRPMIGERVAVFGQGIVGLLTTALLSRFPLGSVMTLDKYPNRRAASLEAGATHCYDPADVDTLSQIRGEDGIDLVFELSGSPAALNQAIDVAGYAGRVVIGSWYGKKRASLDLGGQFHRNRIQFPGQPYRAWVDWPVG
jgi:2-desacetyl-2-hydroxyethyl bacteriochlorophyllide A dehydrogenase